MTLTIVAAFLLAFPLICAAVFVVRPSMASRAAPWAAALLGVVSLVPAGLVIRGGPLTFDLGPLTGSTASTLGDLALAGVFLWACRRLPLRRWWIPLLVVAQYGPVLFAEFTGRMPAAGLTFRCDHLAAFMIALVGVVGGLIAWYTPEYLRVYHREHPEVKDRAHHFIAAVFLFFFAMYGILLADRLTWLYFCWEVTTLCSFIMIGYAQTEEARHNAFRALWMLLLGGAGFAAAILLTANRLGTLSWQALVHAHTPAALLPVALIAFAGMNKAAQFPFARWLLGAMVAPTPSSALLHSSTMVKAGVYAAIRCAPAMEGTPVGLIVALLGGFTFLAASAPAVAERNGKRVLAYSTIANLGLIVMCAGVGTPLALWAAVMLILFHAVAKALLFVGVGTVDQAVGSLDIESMQGLIGRMPRVTVLMLVGMAGMFLAPFGMLISKWAVLESIALRHPLLATMTVFGGSLMLFFWTKWMGALIAVTGRVDDTEREVGPFTWITLFALGALTLGACLAFPWIGTHLIEPMFGADALFSRGHMDVLALLFALMLLLPVGFLLHGRHLHYTEPYLAGANAGPAHGFTDAFKGVREAKLGNYYLTAWFGEARLLRPSEGVAVALLILLLVASWA